MDIKKPEQNPIVEVVLEKPAKPSAGTSSSPKGRVAKWWDFLILGTLMVAVFLVMFFSAKTDSMVVDEKVHISAGYLHVWEGNYFFNPEHPPLLNDLAGLFAKIAKPNLPTKAPIDYKEPADQWSYGTSFFFGSDNDADKILAWARFPFILLTLGLMYLAYLWAREVFGSKAGLVAAALVGFCPNIIAHGRLATTDMGLVFFYVLFFYLLRKFYFKPNWKYTIFLGLALAGVLAAKFSGLFVLPIFALVLLWLFIFRRGRGMLVLKSLSILAIAAVLVWGIYAFSMRNDIAQGIDFGQKIQAMSYSGYQKWLLAPVEKYLFGYGILTDHNAVGHWAYLNGQVGYQGWWQYFPEVLALKLTLPVLFLAALTLVSFVDLRKKFIEEFFLLAPALLYFGLAMTSKIDIGIRHILPVLPFLYISIARLAASKNIVVEKITYLAVGAHVVISLIAYPNYIAYFNQIAGGPINGAKYLADSNLDWNQNMRRFATFTKEKGFSHYYELCWDSESFTYYGIKADLLPSEPVKDLVVICVQQIKVPPSGFKFDWVTKYQPDYIVGDAMYVWDFRNKEFN